MSLFKARPYNVLTDFTFVSITARFEMLLAVKAESPLKSLQDVVTAARNDPGRARAEARAGLEEIASRAATRAEPFVRMASWAVFAGLVVSLIAALLGGTAGARPFPLRVPV